MPGEVKYSRGSVCAPSMGISVGLMTVVTAGPVLGMSQYAAHRMPWEGGAADLDYTPLVMPMLEPGTDSP
jgi:hypothetical protein